MIITSKIKSLSHKKIELYSISKHRTALMGIAAMMILLCHSAARVKLPLQLSIPLSIFNIGVDIFLFLSGMGIYYSLTLLSAKNHGKNDLILWYSKRYIRIIIPWILIVVPFCGFFMYIEGENWRHIVWFLSTMSFWTHHTGFWFISLLIPLYFFSPLLYRFLSHNGLFKLIVILIICFSLALLPIKNETLSEQIIRNIQFAVVRLPSFVCGMVLAPLIMNGGRIEVKVLIILGIFAVLSLAVTKQFVYTYAFMVIPCLVVFATILDRNKQGKFYKGCTFFGKISLESYLFNGAIQIYIIWLIVFFNLPDYNNILMYSLVIIFGTLLSVIVARMSNRITNHINGRLIFQGKTG